MNTNLQLILILAVLGSFCLPGAAISDDATSTTSSLPIAATSTETNLPTMETAEAVMVTAELEFADKVPTIADALKDIERRSQPDDGQGRTFAILDAYGEPTPDGKKLHISMHVSSEKPGIGTVRFKRTGEILWQRRIVPATKPPSSVFAGKGLVIMVNDAQGKPQMLDGKSVKKTIFEATLRDGGEPLESFWPDGEEREVTFFYSSCGCPVKVMARRDNDKTVRTKEMPVIFPDDPAVALTIKSLMGW